MAAVQSTINHNMLVDEKQQTEQPEFRNEGGVDQNVDQHFVKHPLSDSLNEPSNQIIKFENTCLKKTIGQLS
jgi:hypothetical protein